MQLAAASSRRNSTITSFAAEASDVADRVFENIGLKELSYDDVIFYH
jgi:hypothetical protein